MVFSRASASDPLAHNVALSRELLEKEDNALALKKPPHKVVPPFDTDEQEEEVKRKSIAKKVKRAIIASTMESTRSRRSNSNDTTMNDTLMEIFSVHDPRNRGKMSWTSFLEILESSFHLGLNQVEQNLFRAHLHIPEEGTISYVKFVMHLIEHDKTGKTKKQKDQEPEMQSSLPLLSTKQAMDGDDTSDTLTQLAHSKRTKHFLSKLLKQAFVEAGLWVVSVQDVLHRAMDCMRTSNTDEQPSMNPLTQTQFYTSMYVALNVHVDPIESDIIFQQLILNSNTQENLITITDLLNALVRYGLLQPANGLNKQNTISLPRLF